jgi:hypothetical protein
VVIDVVASAPGLGPCGEVVEPDAAFLTFPKPRLLVVRRRAAPGDDLAALAIHTEVVPRVRVLLSELRVYVELEIGAPPPVDEEHCVAGRVDAARRMVDKPLLYTWRIDEIVLSDVKHVPALGVVSVLEERTRRRLCEFREGREERVLKLCIGISDTVIQRVVDPERFLHSVPQPRTNQRVVSCRQTREKLGLFHLVWLEPDEHELHRHRFAQVCWTARIEMDEQGSR